MHGVSNQSPLGYAKLRGAVDFAVPAKAFP
jgi:hypothetical protein